MLTSRRGLLALLTLLCLIGIVEWLYVPLPPAPKKAATLAVEPWQLPPLARQEPDKALDTLKKSSLWGKLPEVEAAKPLNDPEWRFMGIVAAGAERLLIIKVEGQPEKTLKVNDLLPGGSKILKIEEDRICILINGKKRSLGIYKIGPRVL